MIDRIIDKIAVFLALLLVLPVHEFAHAFAADKSGDLTPRLNGRYTLNPLAHFDIIGLVMFLFAGFGWAKPVPVNPANFKHKKLDGILVSSAGVIANYITAFIFYPLALLAILYVPEFGYFTTVLQKTLLYVCSLGLVFFVFNLLPIYPLDGFRIIDSFINKRGKFYYNYRKFGIYFLYALILLSFIADITGIYYLDILGIAINFIISYIQIPIVWFWGLIF